MKPTKTAEELKAMIRREAGLIGLGITVCVKGRDDGQWAFAFALGPGELANRALAAGHDLQRQYDLTAR